jgi:hypothetical protein
VTSPSLSDIASQLGFDAELADNPRVLQKAISDAMRELQSKPALDVHERYAQLTQAYGEVQMLIIASDSNVDKIKTTPSTDLIAIPSTIMSSLLQIIEKEQDRATPSGAPKPNAEVELRESRASLRLEASKDFRNGRTYPFAGIGAAIAVAWSAREPLGITDLQVPDPIYLLGAASGIAITALVYKVANDNQNHDELILDAFYDVELQEVALGSIARRRRTSIGLGNFMSALQMQADRAPNLNLERMPSLRQRRRTISRRFLSAIFGSHFGSTVDLQRGLRDAATLGLERFVAAGILKKKLDDNGIDTVFELTRERELGDD